MFFDSNNNPAVDESCESVGLLCFQPDHFYQEHQNHWEQKIVVTMFHFSSYGMFQIFIRKLWLIWKEMILVVCQTSLQLFDFVLKNLRRKQRDWEDNRPAEVEEQFQF